MTAAICTGACRRGECNCQAVETARATLQPGETLMPSYCWDGALCDCPPTHRCHGVPCISVAVSEDEQTHRCVACGTAWTARECRWQPAHIVSQPTLRTA